MAGIKQEVAVDIKVGAQQALSVLKEMQKSVAGLGKDAEVLHKKLSDAITKFEEDISVESLEAIGGALEDIAERLPLLFDEAAIEPIMELSAKVDDALEPVVRGMLGGTKAVEESAKRIEGAAVSAQEAFDQLGAELQKFDETKDDAAQALESIGAFVARFGDQLSSEVVENLEQQRKAFEQVYERQKDAALRALTDQLAGIENSKEGVEKAVKSIDEFLGKFWQNVSKEVVASLEEQRSKFDELGKLHEEYRERLERVAERMEKMKEGVERVVEATKEYIEHTEGLSLATKELAMEYAPSLKKVMMFGEVLEKVGLKQKIVAKANEAMASAVQQATLAYNEAGKGAKGLIKGLVGLGQGALQSSKGFFTLKGAIASTGIGLLVIALSMVVANLDKIMAFVNELIDKVEPLRAVVDAVLDVAAVFGLAEKRELREARRSIAQIEREVYKLQKTTKASAESLEESLKKETALREKQLQEYAKIAEEKRRKGEKLKEEEVEAIEAVINRTMELYDDELEHYKSVQENKQSLFSAVGVSTLEQEEKIFEKEKEMVERRIATLEEYVKKAGFLNEEQQKQLQELYRTREQMDARSFELRVKRLEESVEREQGRIDRTMQILQAEGYSTYGLEMKKLKMQRDLFVKKMKMLEEELKKKKELSEEDRKQLDMMKEQIAQVDAEMRARAIERRNEIIEFLAQVSDEMEDKRVELFEGVVRDFAESIKEVGRAAIEAKERLVQVEKQFGKNSREYKEAERLHRLTVELSKRQYQRTVKEMELSLKETVVGIRDAVVSLRNELRDMQGEIDDIDMEFGDKGVRRTVVEFVEAVQQGMSSVRRLESSGEALLIDAGDVGRKVTAIYDDVLTRFDRLLEHSSSVKKEVVERRYKRQLEQLQDEFDQQRRSLELEKEKLSEERKKAQKQLEDMEAYHKVRLEQLEEDERRAMAIKDEKIRKSRLARIEEARRALDEGRRDIEKLRRQLEDASSMYDEQVKAIEAKEKELAALRDKKVEQLEEQSRKERVVLDETAKQRRLQLELELKGYSEYSQERLRIEQELVESQIRMLQTMGTDEALEQIQALVQQLRDIETKKAVAPLMDIVEQMGKVGEFTGTATEAIGQFVDMFTKTGRASKAFKAFAVADVLAKTAQSLMNAVVVAQQGAIGTGVLAPFSFLTFLAAQVGTILNAVAQIRQILDVQVEAPQLEPPEFDWGVALANMQNQLATRAAESAAPVQDLRVYVLDSDIVGVRSRNEKIVQATTLP